jgi:hypothetical protein
MVPLVGAPSAVGKYDSHIWQICLDGGWAHRNRSSNSLPDHTKLSPRENDTSRNFLPLWDQKIRYLVQKNQPLDPIPSQLNPVPVFSLSSF